MRNTTILYFIVAFSLLFGHIYAQSKTDFRNTKWGMSRAEVKKLEKSELMELPPAFLAGDANVAGFDASLFYKFGSDKLTEAFYIYKISHYVSNMYIDDYKKIKNILISKYGQPISDLTNWKSETAKAALLDDGLAISMGQLELTCKWDNGETQITHTIKGGDSKVVLLTVYTSKEFQKYDTPDNSDSKDF